MLLYTMVNDTLSHELNGGKVVRKKKNSGSPLSKKYKKFLKRHKKIQKKKTILVKRQ